MACFLLSVKICRLRVFQRQQAHLLVDAARVAGQAAVAAHHPMAGYDDGNRVMSHRAAHSLRGDALSAVSLRQLFCQYAVGPGLSIGDLQQQRPHRLSEIGADKMEFRSKVRLPA